MNILRFEQEWTRVKPDYIHLLRFMRDAIGVEAIEWDDITTLNLSRIRDYLCEKLASNSARTYLAVIKAFLARYADEGIIPCKNPAKELKAKKEPSQHIALTEEEVLMWDKYEPVNDCERDVKIIFMRGCLTGARSSDCKRLSMDNIRDGALVYVSQKTKTEVKQPVHHLLPKYLQEQPKKEHSQSAINKVISRVCRKLGMTEEISLFVGGKLKKGPKYEFISAHSSRRSFCTDMALRNIPVPVIQRIVGHSSASMTERYICVNANNLNESVLDFFNGK